MYGPITYAVLEIVKVHGITPDECSRCKQGTGNWQGPQVDGTTAVTDDGCLVWQCKGCGNIVRLTAEQIEHKARHGDDQDPDSLEIVGMVGEYFVSERWIVVPVEIDEGGSRRHVRLILGSDVGLAVADALYSMVRVDVAFQQQAVAELRTQLH